MDRLIKIDNREGKRINPCKDFFKKTDYETQVEQLKIGDYVCGNTAIEYKATEDLIHSIQNKRIFKQAVNMSNYFKHHFVFMEAEKVKLNNAIRKSQFIGQPFSWKQFYGAYSSLAQITIPVIVPNFIQACELMEYLFEKCNDNKVRNIFVQPKKYDDFLINTLVSIDVVGKNTALLIVDSLNLKTVQDLLNISYEDLIKIKGIGERTATGIMNKIQGEKKWQKN